jgi:hypothetical protein
MHGARAAIANQPKCRKGGQQCTREGLTRPPLGRSRGQSLMNRPALLSDTVRGQAKRFLVTADGIRRKMVVYC